MTVRSVRLTRRWLAMATCEDRGGEGGAGGGAVVRGLTVDIPGEGPALGGDGLQQTGVAHGVFEERAGEGGEGFDRDQRVGAGGPPGRAVRGEATAGHDGVEVRVVRELPAPGVQDPGAPREGRSRGKRSSVASRWRAQQRRATGRGTRGVAASGGRGGGSQGRCRGGGRAAPGAVCPGGAGATAGL